MIMPIVTSISREIFSLTPVGEREGAMALGCHPGPGDPRRRPPFRKGGIIGAIMLGLGRALGEAVAVTIILSMSFGVSLQPRFRWHLDRRSDRELLGLGRHLRVLRPPGCGFVLFVFTLMVNLIASVIVSRSREG